MIGFDESNFAFFSISSEDLWVGNNSKILHLGLSHISKGKIYKEKRLQVQSAFNFSDHLISTVHLCHSQHLQFCKPMIHFFMDIQPAETLYASMISSLLKLQYQSNSACIVVFHIASKRAMRKEKENKNLIDSTKLIKTTPASLVFFFGLVLQFAWPILDRRYHHLKKLKKQ